MNTNLLNYFDNYKRPEIEAYCRGELAKSGVDLQSVILEARRLTLAHAKSKGPNYITRNFMANEMYSNMIGLLYDRYPQMMLKDKESCPYLRLTSDIRIYPKKLSESYVSNNIVTDHVKCKRGQELFDDDTKIHVLFAGPVLEKEDWMLDFKGVYASYVNEYYPRKAAFVIDLSDFAKPLSVDIAANGGPQEPLVKIPGNKNTGKTNEAK